MLTKIGQMDQLNRCDVIAEIAEGRVKHIADKLWEKDADLKHKENNCINFSHFKKLLHRWINILTTRRTLLPCSKEVAANPTCSNNQPRIEQAANCGICKATHRTDACPIILNLTPDERVGKLKEAHLCFHCFARGHIAKFCISTATCGICRKTHATVLHGTTPPSWLGPDETTSTTTTPFRADLSSTLSGTIPHGSFGAIDRELTMNHTELVLTTSWK